MDLRQQLQDTLGSAYALDRELGGGGMSRVFVAVERRLNRTVVIKVLSPELAAGVSAERFEREIQLAASLQQANIVPILTAGSTNGLPFYTMPFVEGESLRARLSQEGRLPIDTIVGVLRDVAKALAYAHTHGVIHRDIKPDNVLLSGGTAVVTDFGIAKALAAARSATESGTLTEHGTTIGTPAYMAPEQAAGDSTIDHRADLYSLGCMAYELLTGRSPFHGRTPARMVVAHMAEAPPPISPARPDVPTVLQQLVRRCLAKDPAERPQSATEIAETLERIGPRNVVSRRAWIGGAATAALLVVSLVLLRPFGIGPTRSLLAEGKLANRERLIVTEFQSADTSLATLVTEAVRTTLGQSRVVSIVPPVAVVATLRRMQRPPSSRLDLTLAREIAQRDGVRAIVDGAIRSIGDGYVVSLRLVSADSASELVAFQEAADNPRELLNAIDKLTQRLRSRIGESLRDVRASPPLEQVTTPSLEALRIYAEAARQLDAGGDLFKGIEQLREAVRLDTGFAMAYRKLGVTLNNTGLPRVAVDSAFEAAYRFRDRLTERERMLTVATYYHLGPGRDRLQALRAYRALLASYPDDASAAANNVGSILSGRRDFAAAETVYKRAMATGRPSAQQSVNLVAVLYNGGKIDEAERYAAESRRRFPGTTFAVTSPANFLYGRGQLDSMETELTKVSKSQDPVLRLQGIYGLRNYSLLRGRIDDALRYEAQSQQISVSLGGSARPPVSDSLELSWIDLLYHDDTSRAKRRVERALRSTDLRTLPLDQRPYLELATFFAGVGDPRRARALLEQYDASMPDSATRRVREPQRHAILGSIALAERRYTDAIRELWRSDTTYDGPDGMCSICVLDDIGRAWDRAGIPDSAIFYWERFLSTPYYGRVGVDAVIRAPILYRLGTLYESKREVANAARRYREFVMLWSRADASLQRKVSDARSHVSRLADVERKER